MVLRRTDPVGVVTQPAHAWLAGQIGRAWGNAAFRRPALFDELLFATDQHDLGFLDWELAPTVDPATGWPHDYLNLPFAEHLALWRRGIARMQPVSRFTALLISRHCAGLYRRHFDWDTASPEERTLMADFLEEQASLQERLTAALIVADRYAPLRDPAEREVYSFLLGTWDLMSLHLCEATGEPLELEETPTLGGPARLSLRPLSGTPTEWAVRPWPFAHAQVRVRFEARFVTPPFESDAALRQRLEAASPRQIEACLRPDE